MSGGLCGIESRHHVVGAMKLSATGENVISHSILNVGGLCSIESRHWVVGASKLSATGEILAVEVY